MVRDIQSANGSKLSRWRLIAQSILALILVVSVFSWVGTTWAERNLLSTDGWITIVGPLPKDAAVSSSLSTFVTSKLVSATDVEQRISSALPERASFLAGPLTDQISTFVTDSTQKFVSSDQFQGIWVPLQTTAHSRLIDRARNNVSEPSENQSQTRFQFALAPLTQAVRTRLGASTEQLLARNDGAGNEVVVNLQTRFQNFSRAVRTIDTLSVILPALIFAAFSVGLAIAYERRVWLLVTSGTIGVVSLLSLAGARILRPEIINHFAQQDYRSAATTIYNALVGPFNQLSTRVFWVAAVVYVLSVLAGPSSAAITIRRVLRLTALQTAWAKTVRSWRLWLARFEWQIAGGLGILTLITLAFWVEVSLAGSLAWALSLIGALGVLHTVVSPRLAAKKRVHHGAVSAERSS